MNERIIELSKQAEQYALDKANEGNDEDYDYSFDDDFQQKFAELIIRESVAVADDYVKDCTCEEHINCKPRTSAIGRKIREHFGVERER